MKKSIRKLSLRKEAVRTLANADLTRVPGGLDANVAQPQALTNDKECPLAAMIATSR